MLYQALATDYDGTIATEGQVDETTITALKRWQKKGRKLILVTGRRLDNLYTVFPQAKSLITVGIVVDNVYKNPYCHDEPSYYRVVEFFTNSPKRLVRIECLDLGLNRPYKLGEKVKVCYSPDSPENAELVHNYWWFPGVFLICVGCGFVIFTLFAPIW